MPILVNITGDDPLSGQQVLRWSTGSGFVSAPDDSPANTVWDPRLIQAGNFERHLFKPGQTFGESDVAYGEIVVNNADAALDHLLSWAFDGRPFEVWRGPKRGRYPADFTLVLRGTLEGHENPDRKQWVFRIRDRRAEIANTLLVSDTYAGDNALPAGLEGAEADLKGQSKPQPYGVVRNATLPMVNTSKVIAQAAARAVQAISVTAVYDRGAVLPPDGAYPSLIDVQDDTKAPAANKSKTYTGAPAAGAYVRLGSSPVGNVTADIIEGFTAASRTAHRLAERIITRAGVSPDDVIGAAALDSIAPWAAGYWTGTSEVKVGEALDLLAASFHGFWVPDRLGRVRLGRLEEPSGPTKLTIEPWMILNDGKALARTVNALEGIPVWRVKVRYQRNWTVQSKDSLAGVALDRKGWLAQEWREITVSDQSVKDRHPLAREIEISTALDSATDARALADFLLRVYRVRRDIYEVGIPATHASSIDLTETAMLRVPRYDLHAGKFFRVIGMAEDIARNRSTLTLWG